MTWRDYSVADFWYGVYAMSPRMLYIADLSMPFLGKLPTQFERLSGWRGQLPYQILGTYLSLTGRSLLETQKTESNGHVTQHLGIVGTDLVVAQTDQDAERAKQNAALMLIHQVQAKDSEFWSMPQSKLDIEPYEADKVVIVVDGGHKNKPVVEHGSKTKIQYRLFTRLTALQNWFLVEWSNGYVLDVCDTSLLSTAVTGLHVNGSVKIEFRTQCDSLLGHDPTQLFCLFVRVLSVIGCPNQVRLFEPPLSQQRYAAVAQQLRLHECHRIIDIGCGEGRFLEALMEQQGTCMRRLYGVDISTSALNRAAARMSHHNTRGDLAVTLFNGNILDGNLVEWKKSVDAAVMIEVIEHLDPDPLSLVGKTVLGIIRPRVFIATTPNWEYNRLLYHVDGIPAAISVLGRDGTPLRCSDHRFEWTRDEFRMWAVDLAESFAYDVAFHGIGEMLLEKETRTELGLVGHDLGQCSQMAVFTAKQPISSCAEAFCATPCKQAKAMWTTFECSDIGRRNTL